MRPHRQSSTKPCSRGGGHTQTVLYGGASLSKNNFEGDKSTENTNCMHPATCFLPRYWCEGASKNMNWISEGVLFKLLISESKIGKAQCGENDWFVHPASSLPRRPWSFYSKGEKLSLTWINILESPSGVFLTVTLLDAVSGAVELPSVVPFLLLRRLPSSPSRIPDFIDCLALLLRELLLRGRVGGTPQCVFASFLSFAPGSSDTPFVMIFFGWWRSVASSIVL